METYQELELRKELLKAWNLLHEEFCGGNWPHEVDYWGNPEKCSFEPPEILGSVDEIVAGLKALEEEFDADLAAAWEAQQAQKGKTLIDPREVEYQELARLGKALKIPTFEAFLELEVRMPDGKIIHHHRQRSHSWVRNAYNLLFSNLAAVDVNDSTFEGGKVSLKSPTGVVVYGPHPMAVPYHVSMLAAGRGYTGAAGSALVGIVVGSGTNAESFEDYALQTLIANGTGAGQLSYVASEAYAISYAALVLTATLIRYINNNSGGSVSVNEVGLIAEVYVNGSGQYCCNSRDKLGSTVTVADTGQLKVTYTIQLTYPS